MNYINFFLVYFCLDFAYFLTENASKDCCNELMDSQCKLCCKEENQQCKKSSLKSHTVLG